MTTIVGVQGENEILMAGDCAAISNNVNCKTGESKVFMNGEFLIGYTSSFRMGQLLEHVFKPPERGKKSTLSDIEYLLRRFIPKMRSIFITHGYESNSEGEAKGGNFLLGYKGTLYEVASDYQVSICNRKYHAVGSGRDTALGSLCTTHHLNTIYDFDIKIQERCLTALHASGELDINTCIDTITLWSSKRGQLI